MCSSEPEAELSLSGPALGTRKRCSDTSLTFSDLNEGEDIIDIGEEGGNNNYPDSDEDFEIGKKKKKVKTVKGKKEKASKELNNSTISKTSTSSDVYIPIPSLESNLTIEVQLKKEEPPNEPEEGYKCNTGVERRMSIATPDQINSRSFDQKESMTPSSCSTPKEENVATDSSNIVHKLVEQVLQAQTPVNLKTSEEMNIKVLPTPNSNQLNWPVGRGRGRGFRPSDGHPLRPGQARHPTPGTRPSVRTVGPRMLRPLKPGFPSGYRSSQAVPRPGLATGGPRLPNIRSTNHIKRRSLSTPLYPSQCTPPVVELDASPPKSDQNINVSYPPANSIVNKLTSMGLSVAMEKAPTTKQGWVVPPGLSVIRTLSTEAGPSTSHLSLARALLELGEVQGRKRLVQYQLTESQVRALQTLGLREEDG